MTVSILDILTILSLSVGLFFMFIGALGALRLPDLYSRIHAASKCITLGISGMLIAAVFHFSRVEIAAVAPAPPGIQREAAVVATPAAGDSARTSKAVAAITKAVLVIIFQFVAAPVAAHMLSRAAHLDGQPVYHGMISDELAEDQHRPAKSFE